MLGISEPRVARMSQAKLAASHAASRSLDLRGRRKRSWPDHVSRGIFEPRVAMLSPAKLARQPRAQHFRTQSYEDVSGETGWITSRAACGRRTWLGHLRSRHTGAQSRKDTSGGTGWTTSRAPPLSHELRGCLERNWPDQLSRGI